MLKRSYIFIIFIIFVVFLVVLFIVLQGGYSQYTGKYEVFQEAEIILPESKEEYREKMTEYVQAGGENPFDKMRYIKKKIQIRENEVREIAEYIANYIYDLGTEKIKVEYLEIKNKTVYLLFNIDTEGWAGVSVARGIVHPLVEKNLLNLPQVDRVIFDYSSEDNSG